MSVSTTVVSGQHPSSGPAAAPPTDIQASATTPPTAIAVSLGSGRTHVWVAGRGSLSCPTGDTVGTARDHRCAVDALPTDPAASVCCHS